MMESTKQDGFSLVEVLVTVAIIGIISAGFMALMKNQTASMRYLEDKMSYINFEKELAYIFLDDGSCIKTLENLRVPESHEPPTTVVLKNRSGQVLYKHSNPHKNTYDGLKINNIYLTNDTLDTSISNTGVVSITIEIERVVKGGGPSNLKDITLKQLISVAPSTRKIETCTTATSEPQFFSFSPSPSNSWGRPDQQYIGEFKFCALSGFNQRHSHKGLFHMFIEAGSIIPNSGGKRTWYAFNSSEGATETLEVICY